MMGDNNPPEVTAVEEEGDEEEDETATEEPAVLMGVAMDVTMVTRVGAEPTEDDVSFLLTETGRDPVVVEEREPLGSELTKMLWFCRTPELVLMRLMGTGTAIPPPGMDTPVSDTCMFCRPWRLAMLTPGSPVRFWMLMLGGSPMLVMLMLAMFCC